MNLVAACLGLFGIAFAAATILPLQSEATLLGLIYTGKFSIPLLVAVASLGNTLGAVVNWWMGRQVERFRGRRWFPASDRALAKARAWYARYGRWTLLLSWLPLGGDALTVAAGVMREPLLSFVLFVAIAKTGRYVVLVLAALQVFG
ncbi:YqaA family protein [Ensifer soli]|uniref:YqaA family protein n=1 Tax=Ciceribacter sp. sgz301302 TaxID=3342379 RepID=UPI0035BA1278